MTIMLTPLASQQVGEPLAEILAVAVSMQGLQLLLSVIPLL